MVSYLIVMDLLTLDNYMSDPFYLNYHLFLWLHVQFLLTGVMQVQSQSTTVDQTSNNSITHEESTFCSPAESTTLSLSGE